MELTIVLEQEINQINLDVEVGDFIINVVPQEVAEVTLNVQEESVFIPPADLLQRLTDLETLKPIIQREDVVLGNLETVTMPVGNPNIIGMVQQIDEADGNKVYYPNFTTANNGRSAIFYSVLTQLENKIVIWPRPSEV
jgi:hypothetical protein